MGRTQLSLFAEGDEQTVIKVVFTHFSKMANLLDLPEEIQVAILSKLDATSLCSTSLTCQHLNHLAKEEEVWVALAKRLHGVDLHVSDSFSPRQFYKAWLHKLGPLLGLWQRTDLRYCSGLVRVIFKEQAVHVDLVSSQQLDQPLKVTPLLRAKAERNRRPQLDRFGIYKYCTLRRIELSFEKGFFVISAKGLPFEDATKEDFARYAREELEDAHLDPEEFLDFDQRLPVQRCREIFYNRSFAAFRRFSWPSPTPTSPMSPGLFQASYGSHGIELIRLEVPLDNSIKGVKGVKITGDPNVPFDKTTFEIDAPGCLDIPMEEQQSCRTIQRFMEEPSVIDFQDGLVLDFAIPEDIRMRERAFTATTCKGRWSCKCQVAGHGYSQPSFIAGNFIKFSDDLFGVMFLEM